MDRTAYKTLSSELRKSLFKGEFHASGSVMMIKHKSGLEAVSLDRLTKLGTLPIDRAWMSKSTRRHLLTVDRKYPSIPLPR